MQLLRAQTREVGGRRGARGAAGQSRGAPAGSPAVALSSTQAQGSTLRRARVRPGGRAQVCPAREGAASSAARAAREAQTFWGRRCTELRPEAREPGPQRKAHRGRPRPHPARTPSRRAVSTGATPSGRHHLLSWAGPEMATSAPSLELPTPRATGAGGAAGANRVRSLRRGAWGCRALTHSHPPVPAAQRKGRRGGLRDDWPWAMAGLGEQCFLEKSD